MNIMTQKRQRLIAGLTLVLLGLNLAASAADPIPDGDQSEVWKKVRASYFEGRSVVDDIDGKVVALKAPMRAEDASTVPIQIKTGLSQSKDRYIQKLYLFIDANPSPVAAI